MTLLWTFTIIFGERNKELKRLLIIGIGKKYIFLHEKFYMKNDSASLVSFFKKFVLQETFANWNWENLTRKFNRLTNHKRILLRIYGRLKNKFNNFYFIRHNGCFFFEKTALLMTYNLERNIPENKNLPHFRTNFAQQSFHNSKIMQKKVSCGLRQIIQ